MKPLLMITCAQQNMVKLQVCNFIKKETLTKVFSCEFCEIFKNTFFYRTPQVTASDCFWSFVVLSCSKTLFIKRENTCSRLSQPALNLFKVNNGNIRAMCEIYSNWIVKTPERRCASVSFVDFEQVNTGWGQWTY